MTDRQQQIVQWMRNAAGLFSIGFGFGFGAAAFYHRGEALSDIGQVVEIVGKEGGMIAVVIVIAWRTARWLRPWMEKIANRHLAFLDSAQRCNEDNAENLKELCNSQRATEKAMKEMRDSMSTAHHEQSGLFRGLHQSLERIAENNASRAG